MSFFSWFRRKPETFQASAPDERSDLPGADATVPLTPGKTARLATDTTAQVPDHVPNLKAERMERREMLYAIVRDAMVRAGVLSASYKFKVLALDQRGKQFLVMMELARDYGGEMARLSEIEALIAQTAKSRNDILVTAVYWRTSDHVAVGIPQKGISPHGVALPPTANGQRTVRPKPNPTAIPTPVAASINATTGVQDITAPLVAATAIAGGLPTLPTIADEGPVIGSPAVAKSTSRFDPIEPDEVAAFQRALETNAATAAAVVASQPVAVPSVGARSVPPLTGYEDTEVPVAEGVTQDLSATQYGQLN
jgi:hypothetical protein